MKWINSNILQLAASLGTDVFAATDKSGKVRPLCFVDTRAGDRGVELSPGLVVETESRCLPDALHAKRRAVARALMHAARCPHREALDLDRLESLGRTVAAVLADIASLARSATSVVRPSRSRRLSETVVEVYAFLMERERARAWQVLARA